MSSLWFSLDVIPVGLLKMKANLITRYKSLCLGLLGQLKKMHIQLPILYVVKVQLHIREGLRKKIRNYLGIFPNIGGGVSSFPKLLLS